MSDPQTTKIYVIHWGHAYETGSWPEGVYSTIEKGRKAFAGCKGRTDFVELLEYDLDAGCSPETIESWKRP